jgi:uncharacterized Ntn-hydrolase superfamily protein
MKRMLFLLTLLVALRVPAFATWSIVAVDRSTGRVVSASATCVDGDDNRLTFGAAVVVPGKGVAACQAGTDPTHQNQFIVFEELQKGTDPQAIIEMLSQDPAFQNKQYGIVDLQGRAASHTGLNNGFVAQDIHGQVPGTEIFYSIQANSMRAGNVVPNAVKAFIGNKGALTDRVMAAMDAADASGGDSRCTCPPPPADGSQPLIACDAKTAHVAYILLAEPNDTNGDLHSNGKYRMYITVSQPDPVVAAGQPAPTIATVNGVTTTHGPSQIKKGENLNPTKTLRMRYDVWRKAQPADFK